MTIPSIFLRETVTARADCRQRVEIIRLVFLGLFAGLFISFIQGISVVLGLGEPFSLFYIFLVSIMVCIVAAVLQVGSALSRGYFYFFITYIVTLSIGLGIVYSI